jgi:hypothetical protein
MSHDESTGPSERGATGPSESDAAEHGPLELRETLYIETKDGSELPFEVVGMLEDPDNSATYAVLMHEGEDEDEREFIVTDINGDLLTDDGLAQEILDEFLLFAEEAGEDDESLGAGSMNGSASAPHVSEN